MAIMAFIVVIFAFIIAIMVFMMTIFAFIIPIMISKFEIMKSLWLSWRS